jgi:hypothetical protein
MQLWIRKVRPVESFCEISFWKLDMGMWDTIKQNISNNYASVQQNVFTLPHSRWNLQGICWSVCAVLRRCWQLEALKPQPQE